MDALLELPESFSAIDQDYVDFSRILDWFDWTLENRRVVIDFRNCRYSNYQALALLVEYMWVLRTRGCELELWQGDDKQGTAYEMWKQLGAIGWSQVLRNENEQFKSTRFKPLIAVRSSEDRKYALKALAEYIEDFPIDYKDYLSDVVNELIYNTLEHGLHYEGKVRVPSLVEFSWYQNRDEFAVLIADTGIGVKLHLEKNYKAFESDVEALRHAILPETSGTFGSQSAYSSRNNAGMGLFVSSRLMQMLRGDLWIVSGRGQLHISPRETTSREFQSGWPGTFALLSLKLKKAPPEVPHNVARSEVMEEARRAREGKEGAGATDRVVISIFNYFGRYAEDKEEAIRYRDKYLIPAAQAGRQVLLDFAGVDQATHSFLNALLAGSIRAYADKGLNPYKFLRCTNESQGLRETVEFILDTNT